MELINSRYRVKEILKEDMYGYDYLVKDMHKDGIAKKMRIINSVPETLKFIEYMKLNFFDYVNMSHPNIAKFYYFNRVDKIDTKPIIANRFYYTYEHFNGENIFKYSEEKSLEELLYIIKQLCSLLKYLHLKGFVLCKFSIDDIYVIRENGEVRVKLVALPYPDLSDNSIIIDKGDLRFKSPEALQFGQFSIKNDIFILGMLMKYIFFGRQQIMTEINRFDDESSTSLLLDKSSFLNDIENKSIAEACRGNSSIAIMKRKIRGIIEKCLLTDVTYRYDSVDQVIDDINKGFNKNYNIIDKKYIQTLPKYATKLVGRESFIKEILKNIRDRSSNKESEIKGTVILGSFGTGKNAFIDVLLTRLRHEGKHVLYSILKENSIRDYAAITDLVVNTLKYTDKEILDKYSVHLRSIVPEIFSGKEEELLKLPRRDGEVYRTVYRFGNFLLEVSQNQPLVIAIKNYEYIDEYSKRVINYILSNQEKGKIYFIFTFDREISQDEAMEDFIPYLRNSEINFINLYNLNIFETVEVIGNLLSISNPAIKFTTKIFEKTQGNPYLIYEIVYILVMEEHIFVNDRGEWVLDKVDLDEINLPTDVEQISFNKVGKLDRIKKEILNVMSVFATAVSVDILENMFGKDIPNLSAILYSLVRANILSQKVDDYGISYDYKFNGLKKKIYQSLSDEDKFKYHKKAAEILETRFSSDKRGNKDELIYHMSKSGKQNEAVEYLIISSKEMQEKNLFNQAIQFLEQAFFIVNKNHDFKRRLEISLKLGDLYFLIGSYDKCEKYYKEAQTIATVHEETILLIDVYINMVRLNYKMGNIKELLKYSKKARTEIIQIGYQNGLYDLIIAMSDLMIYRRKSRFCIKIVEKLLEGIDVKDKYYYGMFMCIYGRALRSKDFFKESEDALRKGIDALKDLGDSEGLASALNAMGTIYSEYYNDIEKAKNYFEKVLNVCQRINNVNYMMYSYNNLGEMCRIQSKLEESLDYYNKALSLAEHSKNIYVEVNLYVNTANIRFQKESYREYIDSMAKAKDILLKYKESGETSKYYYINKGLFFYKMGEYKKALDYTQKSVDMCINWGVKADLEAVAIKKLCKVKLGENLSIKGLKEFCLEVFNDKRFLLCRQTCHEIAKYYIEEGFDNNAKEFLAISNRCEGHLYNEFLNVEYDFLLAMTYKGKERVKRLKHLSRRINRLGVNEIKCNFYYSLGSVLLDFGEYEDALKYLIKSFNYLRILIHEVPEEYKVIFLYSHERSLIKEKIIALIKRIIEEEELASIKDSFLIKLKQEIYDFDDYNIKLKPNSYLGRSIDKRDKEHINEHIDRYFEYEVFRELLRKIQDYRYKADDEDKGRIEQGKLLSCLLYRISKLGTSVEKNIKEIVQFLADSIQAENTFLSIVDERNETRLIYSKFQNEKSSFYNYITEKVRQTGESVVIIDAFEYRKKFKNTIIPKEMNAIFCIPIIPYDDYDGIEKRRSSDSYDVKGYLYFDTDSVINNFSELTAEFCEAVSKIAYILIDNYNLRAISSIDKLTGLYTRKYFESSLQKEILNASMWNQELSVIMMDIDRFKAVNDRFGHQIGDEILSQIASLIMTNIRETDICGRYGGEEFVLLLPSTSIRDAYKIAENLRKKIKGSVFIESNIITISMGIAVYPEHSIWMKDLIDKADQALYYSKENGRDRTTIYDVNMGRTVKRADKLTGIISGNMVDDMRNVEIMIETLELQCDLNLKQEEKVFDFLGKIIEVSGAKAGSIFILDDDKKPIKQISRKRMVNRVIKDMPYSRKLLMECIENAKGNYSIDYDNSAHMDAITGMPSLQSKMLVPIKNRGKILAVLYLSVFLKDKEFDANIYNFVENLCKIISPIF